MSGEKLPLETGVEEVHGLLDSATPPRLIDCRENDEWRHCRIEGAELVPLSQFGELASRRFNDPNEHLIIYCHHGMRSQRAALWLRQQGFARAQSMRGGIDLWSDLIDPAVPRY
jgi:rhodanese-related sulfurtransferase